jgi:hypothetical protein
MTYTNIKGQQAQYARSDQPIADLMVKELGKVFPSNGSQWAISAINHLQQRANSMRCHRLGKSSSPRVLIISRDAN